MPTTTAQVVQVDYEQIYLVDFVLVLKYGHREVENLPEIGDEIRVLPDRPQAGAGSRNRNA